MGEMTLKSSCCRSRKYNFDGMYEEMADPDFQPDMLFDALEIRLNREMPKYCILPDEPV